MCGIAGYAGWPATRDRARSELKVMCDAIVHRGPDEAGYYVADGIAMGMRRLSIIDLAGGSQPIGNEDGSIQVVFNGEIYNYRELRQWLAYRGHRFSTHTDTETLVHLYEELGDDMVQQLRGMFAFALWDAKAQRLLVVRDRLGVKPLYYWEGEGGVAFASELKSLRRLERFPMKVDSTAVARFLALGYVPDPDCAFSGVHKLEPGHVLSWQREQGVKVTRYWSPVRPENSAITEAEAVAEIRRLLTEAVRYRLIADVPLGAFLSGGIDSTAVVAEMARQMDRPVQTFSIGFDEPEFNEAPYAAEVARALRTEHTELIVRPDVDELVESLILSFDEPFADASAIPTLLVSQLARSKVKVVLSGDGGDEIFGGYTRYLNFLRRDVPLPQGIRSMMGGVARSLPHSTRGRNRLLELSRGVRGRYAGLIARPLSVEEGGVARPEIAALGRDLDALLERWFEPAKERDWATQVTLVDIQSYLPGDILTKVDRMSMAASIEAREPLLDHKLVEFGISLPSHMKMRDGTGKWIFREALKGQVPDSIFSRPKQGFAVPLGRWFKHELRYRLDALTRRGAELHEYVEPAAVRRIVAEHQSGRRMHSGPLWRLVVLDTWLSRGMSSQARRDAFAGMVLEAVG